MHEKILKLAAVLMALPEEFRLRLARHILPATYAVVPRQCNRAMEEAFRKAARSFHAQLNAELKFSSLAIGPCWHETVAQAAVLTAPPAGSREHEERNGASRPRPPLTSRLTRPASARYTRNTAFG